VPQSQAVDFARELDVVEAFLARGRFRIAVIGGVATNHSIVLHLMRFRTELAVIATALCVSACSEVPEPGIPVQEPSPLFADFTSYRTLQELKPQLPDKSTWQTRADSVSEPRTGCPRFDELTFAVPADHLGQHGTLQLTFINDRLKATGFTPDDFPSYVKRLEQSGIKFNAQGNASVAPATFVWRFDRQGPIPPFVGWRDTRFQRQVDAWLRACS
jgi:hypothetical protein